MGVAVNRKQINMRLPEDTFEDMDFIANHLAAHGDLGAIWDGEPNRTYAVMYAIRKLADELRQQDTNKRKG